MGRSTDKETGLSEQRKYRSWTAQQKLEIVLAGLRGDRAVKEVCREHAISETLYYGWREKLLEGGREALAGKEERQGERELRRKVAELERALGRKTYELEIAGKAVAGVGVRQRVARSRELVAEGHSPSVVARVAADQPPGALPDADAEDGCRSGGRPADPVEPAIVEEALANQTDGYRMVDGVRPPPARASRSTASGCCG